MTTSNPVRRPSSIVVRSVAPMFDRFVVVIFFSTLLVGLMRL
jgi:hypothetical protein